MSDAASAPASIPMVVAVVVSYRPVMESFRALLDRLAPQVTAIVVVDDGTPAPDLAAIREVVAGVGGQLLELGANRGLAAAQNHGVEHARGLGATHVLLSDHDSAPADDMVVRLLDALAGAEAAGRRVAAVGPVITDERVPDVPLAFMAGRWRACQVQIDAGAVEPLPAAFLLASGSLVPLRVWDAVGPKRTEWFIDWLDLDWCLRARRLGLEVLVVPDARLTHRMGDRVVRIPGRSRAAHLHPTSRVYYVVRNLVLLCRSELLPVPWRVGYSAWLLRYSAFNVLFVPPRRRRARSMAAGLRDGLRSRTGPRP